MQWLRLEPEEQTEVLDRLHSHAGLDLPYALLMVFSAILCTFGLLADSAAAVIGAATMAPLSGPILGISLGLMRGELTRFRRSLTAEATGALVCLLSGFALGRFFGPSQIDYTQAQITANLHPTLLDLAMGLAAGLAGAYVAVDRRVADTVAGVAIAITLVPPLCAAGLCLAGRETWHWAPGGLVLFFANFVAIQLAAAVVFTIAGLSRWGNLRRERSLWGAFLFNVTLLALTSWFLTEQLHHLLEERQDRNATRQVTERALVDLPGARLERLSLRENGDQLQIDLLVRAPQEVTVAFTRQLREDLQQRLGRPVQLQLGTALSSFVTPSGRLFAPQQSVPTAEEAFRAQVAGALEEALRPYPLVDLISFRILRYAPPEANLFVSLRSPFVFKAERVQWLAEETARLLGGKLEVNLTVRTSLTEDYTQEGPASVALDRDLSPAEKQRQELEGRARDWLQEHIEEVPQARIRSVRATVVPLTDDLEELQVELDVQAARPVPAAVLTRWRDGLQKEVGLPTRLEESTVLGDWVQLPAVLPSPRS